MHWDLSVFYKGVEDPQIDLDVAELILMFKDFNSKYKGQLSVKLGEALKDLWKISMLQSKLGYFSLIQSLKVDDAKVKARMAVIENKVSLGAGEYLTFFDIELVALEDKVLEELYKQDDFLAKHKPYIDHTRIYKPHFLSEEVEGALTKRSPFGPGAWGEFFDELESDLRFEFDGEKKSLTEMNHILSHSKNDEEREGALGIINAGLGGTFAKYSAQTLYMVAGSKAVEGKERKYRHPMESRNKSNRIPDGVVESLHTAIKDVGGPLTRRYYQLKAAHLGFKTLKWSDRNAPLPFADTTKIPFGKAFEMVLDAYESFSPTLAGIVRNGAKNGWIDSPAVKGKRSGAFNCSLILPGNKPVAFTFLNYLGSGRDVMTLAHELGHGVHGILSAEAQGPLMCDAPMAYAELASTFGEMTTFNFVKEKLLADGDKKALLALVMEKIEDTLNTTVRQICFSNFERRLHGMDREYKTWGEVKKLSPEELDNIWLETTRELYGPDGDVFTYENTEHLWTYIHHFHRPFYVYCYACAEFLTWSVIAQKERLGDRFEPLYLDLLRAGSTKDAVELTKPFGFDPTTETFWADAINNSLGNLIEEAERLSRETGLEF